MAKGASPTSIDRASFRTRLAFLNRRDRNHNTGNPVLLVAAVAVVDAALAVLDDRPGRLLTVAVIAVAAAAVISYAVYPLRRLVPRRAVASTAWVALLTAGCLAGIAVTVRVVDDERTTFAWFFTYLAVVPATALLDAAVPALFDLRFPAAEGDDAGERRVVGSPDNA
jgi:hypothetical protein